MRQSIICCFALLTIAGLASGQQATGDALGWHWQNPRPQGNNLRDVYFITPLIGTAVGEAGTILRTTDGGSTWVSQRSGTHEDLLGVSFVGPMLGVAVGTGGKVLRTFDGGETWMPLQSGTTGTLRSVTFTDALNGTAVESAAGIRRTTDGGETWQPVSIAGSAGLLGVHFRNALRGIAVGNGGRIFRTTDGGVSWFPQNSGTMQNLYAVFFPTDDFGLAAGTGGVILRTTNGGNAWTPLITGVFQPFYGITFGDSLNGIAVGLPGLNFHTTDGGASWFPRPSGTLVPLSKASFVDGQTGFAVGDYGTILQTDDGGNNWVTQSSGTTNTLFGVSFASASRGVSVGDFGTILRTTNGGDLWQTISSGTTATLWSVSLADQNTGTAVGSSGVILRTTTGGASWTPQSSGTQAQLLGVSHAGPSVATAVGTGGMILQTTDGGTTWLSRPSGVGVNLNSVHMVDASTAFAAGNAGVVLRTTNGGANWENLTTGTSTHLFGICFADAQNGTVVGGTGTILRTTTGGNGWVSQPAPATATLNSVCLATPSIGTAVGYMGTVVRTLNGGATWTSQASGTVNYLACVDMVDADHGTAVGLSGTILHTNTGGEAPAPRLVLSPASLAFGDVAVGTSDTDTVTVTNTGTEILMISEVESDNSRFSVTPASAALAPSASREFYVTFSPASGGPKSAVILFRSNAPASPDTLHATGTGATPVQGTYVSLTPDSIRISDAAGKFLKPVKRGKRLFPNWVNLVSETVVQGGFQPGATCSDQAGGMRIGISWMGLSGPNRWKPLPDSAARRCWVRLTRWSFSKWAGSSHTTLQKTLRDNTGIHDGPPRGFDATGVPGDPYRKPLVKQQMRLVPKKHNNALFAELVALKLNIAASQLGKTPVGFGELVFDRPGHFLHNHAVLDIAELADTMMTYWQGRPQEDFDSLFSVVSAINRAFVGRLDTVSFEADAELILRGAVDLRDVPFLKPGPNPPRRLVRTTNATEDPDEEEFGDEETGPDGAAPVAARLFRNYPNPFNPTTTLAFRLNALSSVTIRVFDLVGRQVATLLEGEEMDEGYQTVEFEAPDIASGVYFYRVEVEGIESPSSRTVQTGKMVMMK